MPPRRASDTRVCERDGLRFCVAWQQRLRHDQTTRNDCTRAHQEFAPVDASAAILVVEVEDAPVDFELGYGFVRAHGRGLLEED